ncbi:oocyte zinc finger protein XlCOF29-like [Bufo gargarizans]|uniref:oocyte zinc finger protein XlCOF29-like n=1 Tax=Bufo gargarizans TaxID=30331 RepID=UPI001CF55C2C|nr:oocyte zinc finger protein XlCOF29-like [Bufo gargarizans]
MDRDKDKMAESIINLTLEILFRLTGEDYTVVKKTSSERCQAPVSEGWERTLSPIMEPPLHPLIHEEINREKILELTNKMIELLTGQVPIRLANKPMRDSQESLSFDDLCESRHRLGCPEDKVWGGGWGPHANLC